ncbi:MAG: hypothetical protein LBM65_01675 [Oscillospiraceae bacterium]|nr:hypothetical protein [Oscillospiraceae bacterium]
MKSLKHCTKKIFKQHTKLKRTAIAAVLLLAFFITQNTAFNLTANAVQEAQLTMQIESADKNRIFPISFLARTYDFKIAALHIKISYNPEFLSYRSVKTNFEDCVLKANDKSGKVDVIFMFAEGIDITTLTELFSVNFKAIADGVSAVAMNIIQVIDSDINEQYFTTSNNLDVTVNGNKISSKSTTVNNPAAQNQPQSGDPAALQSLPQNTNDGNAQNNDASSSDEEQNGFLFIPGGNTAGAFFAGAGFVGFTVIVGYLVRRFAKARKAAKQKSAPLQTDAQAPPQNDTDLKRQE